MTTPKFNGSAVCEALYNISLNGCCDSTGECDGPGWYARIDATQDELVKAVGEEYREQIVEEIEGRPEVFAILREDNYGLVSYDGYDTEKQRDKSWRGVERRVESFYDQSGE